MVMNEKEWEQSIRDKDGGCPLIIDVRGGCNCRRPGGIVDYCTFGLCPRRPENEK
jgi:hypothetical protein